MAARDKYHFELRQALEKDGWVITHDPYVLEMAESKYERLMKLTLPKKAIERYSVNLLIFNPESKNVVQWIRK